MVELNYSIGGNRAQAAINKVAAKYSTASPTLKVGFLENAKYPDGTSVAMIAMIQEFGANIEREPSDPADGGGVTIYRKMNRAGTGFARKGRFVKANTPGAVASTHYVGAHTIVIPPRPFFRTMVAQNEASWAPQAAALLKQGMSVDDVLQMMGHLLAGQLRASIIAMNVPPNAPSTIRRKGSAKPLVDTGFMLSRVDFEVG